MNRITPSPNPTPTSSIAVQNPTPKLASTPRQIVCTARYPIYTSSTTPATTFSTSTIVNSPFTIEVQPKIVSKIVTIHTNPSSLLLRPPKPNTNSSARKTESFTRFASLSKTTTMISATKKMKFSLFITTIGRWEWRPPWRPVETSPNATKRIE
ncbi:hypothetical protein Hanom_Chr16g01430871 [Helianthus anomalus]